MKKRILLILAAGACSLLPGTLRADIERCPILSAGAETTLPGSYHNVGQSVIGLSTNATTIAHHGGLACLRVFTTCLLGDVNGDGEVNSTDIGPYTDVKLTGVGTPRELCAATPDIAAFVVLLLNK
jgi:hypothetical protein